MRLNLISQLIIILQKLHAIYNQQRLDKFYFGGGVSIYVRHNIKFLTRNDISSRYLEMLYIKVQPPKRRPFLIICWYNPSNAPVGIFTKAEKVLSDLDKEAREIVVVGETNCNLSSEIIESSSNSNSCHI